ncbi:hypothetical protein HanPSC8_Chr17g0786161 [Helianthus annuus]|nr:hypothetical protein HanPSC8_Chr17g0786161 [Helianthus annuus]
MRPKEETDYHVLWNCWIAKSVWWTILIWVKIPFPNRDLSIQELLRLVTEMRGSKDWKKLIVGIFLVTA